MIGKARARVIHLFNIIPAERIIFVHIYNHSCDNGMFEIIRTALNQKRRIGKIVGSLVSIQSIHNDKTFKVGDKQLLVGIPLNLSFNPL